MCGRYYIDDGIDANELREIIDEVNRHSNADQVKTSGEVFPTDTVPIIANSRAMVPSAFAMSWGYSLPDGKRIINARSETAEEKAMFRDGMAQRRCVVPATNYFEWERAGKQKTKYAIRPAGNGLMYMAGIYRVENGRPVFTILRQKVFHSYTTGCPSFSPRIWCQTGSIRNIARATFCGMRSWTFNTARQNRQRRSKLEWKYKSKDNYARYRAGIVVILWGDYTIRQQ